MFLIVKMTEQQANKNTCCSYEDVIVICALQRSFVCVSVWCGMIPVLLSF